MIDPGTLTTVGVVVLASAFMAWTIGAGSSGSTPFAPAVGANAISVMRAGFVVGILGLAGAVLQGANVAEGVGRELVVGEPLTAPAAALALTLAASLVAIGIFTGYPIATAFTVTGAVVGVGLATGGDPAWTKYREIVTLWVLIPFFGGGAAYTTAKLLRSDARTTLVFPALGGVVGGLLANVEFAMLGPAGEGSTLAVELGTVLPGIPLVGRIAVTGGLAAALSSVVYREMQIDPLAAQRRMLLAMGGLVAFSAGGSQVGLAIGPLLPLFEPTSVPPSVILAGGGLGLLLGSWTGAPRMIKAVAQDYSSLGPRRSIAALIPSFVIAQAAVLFGIPVSFNEIIISAIVGSGYATGEGGVSRGKMVYTVLAWVASLTLALVVGYGGYVLIRGILGG